MTEKYFCCFEHKTFLPLCELQQVKQNNGVSHRLKGKKKSCQALWQRHKKSIQNTKIYWTKASMPFHSKSIDNCLWNHNHFSDEYKLNGWPMNQINYTFIRFSKKKKTNNFSSQSLATIQTKLSGIFARALQLSQVQHYTHTQRIQIFQWLFNLSRIEYVKSTMKIVHTKLYSQPNNTFINMPKTFYRSANQQWNVVLCVWWCALLRSQKTYWIAFRVMKFCLAFCAKHRWKSCTMQFFIIQNKHFWVNRQHWPNSIQFQ